MLRSIAWIGLSFFVSIRSNGQDVLGQPRAELTSKAPEVGKMQQYIDFPVSNFTGTADVNIPVHDLTSRGNNVSISLHYHTGGIKAEEQATFVGLGWMLNSGGYISRTIRGNKDEGIRYQTAPRKILVPTVHYLWDSYTDSMAYYTHIYGGFYMDGGNNMPSQSSAYSVITSHNQTVAAGNDATSDASTPLFNSLDDAESDLYRFDFGGYSGKFVFLPGRVPLLIPYNQDLKITPTLQVFDEKYPASAPGDTAKFESHYFSSFKVSTPDGKDYYFGENDSARVNNPFSDGFYTITAWLLTRVIDRTTLDTIYFTYQGSNSTTSRVRQLTKFLNANEVSTGCAGYRSGIGSEYQPGTVGIPLKIISSKEVLDFFYSGVLDSIKVSDRMTGIPYKKMQFDYGGFLSRRTKLIGFTVKDLKTNEYLPYSFNYYDTAGWVGAWGQDYWGYYNGAINNKNLFTSYPGCDSAKANRSPAWPAMKQDALTEVYYPTGGKTIFEYEPHTAYTGRKPDGSIASGDAYFVGSYNNFSLPSIIGGIRIKRMLIYDPLTKDTLIRRFSYLQPGGIQSSGFLYVPPKLVADVSSFSCPSNTPGVRFYVSTSPVYTGTGSDPDVSYSNVQVQEEKNGLINGHSEYDYYDNTNTDSSFYANALTNTSNAPLTGPYDVMSDFTFRKLPENFLLGKEKQKRIYNVNGDLLTKETTLYKAHVYGAFGAAQLTAVLRDNICGPKVNQGNGTGTDDVYGTFVSKYDPNTKGSPSVMVFVTLDQNGGNNGRPLLSPPQSYYYYYPYSTAKTAVQLFQKIAEYHPSTLGYTTDTTTYTYDNTSHVNPTVVTNTSSKGETVQQRTLFSLDFNDVNSGDSTFYFMRLAGVNVPVAKFYYNNSVVVGGGYRKYALRSRADSTIFLQLNEYSLDVQSPGIAPAVINLGSTLPQALNFPTSNFATVASYTYNSDNTVASITKKGSDKAALLWDYNNNYVVAQTVNADSSDIAFTGFETTGNGRWTVGSPLRVITSAVTGKQSYNLSNGNITRSGLNASKTYVVSYWSLTTSATVNSAPAVAGNVKNGWHYFEHKLPVGTTSITVSGTVTIDELRLYPSDAQMRSFAFDPMVGMTASVSPNGAITYYEYDGVGKLRFIRDADRNILKAAQYFYTVYGADTAIWRSAGGNTRMQPCPANTAYNSDTLQKQQIDINPNSSTFGTLQWAIAGVCGNCDVSAWQDTGAVVRCIKDTANNNTGYQEKEQKDMNPCSPTFSQKRWVSVGLNTTACPIPPPPCTGPDKMMINGVCRTGQRVNTASVYNNTQHKYACTYHYEWLPDCIKGSDIVEYNTTACSLGNPCIPQ
jgi:YD repeat-containing protein